jgi:RNA-directed DNA polymerase
MKSYKNLYHKIISFPNLYYAYRRARKGKREQQDIANFEFKLERNLLKLGEELASFAYKPGSYKNFYISEPKRRLISAAPFRDRVVHHALCKVIEPIWESRFYYHSYACRIGKGTHAALDRASEWVRKYKYVFHGDIVKYFPSIDHKILYQHIAHRIRDKKVLWLVKGIIDGGAAIQQNEKPILYFPGDDLFSILRPSGLPIGNLTSQFWANLYLHMLDKFIKEELSCHPYLRYMDDFLLFSDDKNILNQWKMDIKIFLGSHLRLLLHENKSVVKPTRTGLDFCGFVLFPEYRKIRKSSAMRFIKRFKRQRRLFGEGLLSLDILQESVQSWIAHAEHGNTWGLRKDIFRKYPLTYYD